MGILQTIRARIRKSQPGSSSVHVPVPLGSDEDKVKKIDLNPPVNTLDVELAKAAWAAVQKDELSAQGREHVKDTNFALPESRGYPIHDMSHARNALARASGKPEEAKVKAAVYHKYPSLKPVEKAAAPTSTDPVLGANELISGIDWEMAAGAPDVATAEKVATENLSKDPMHYRASWADAMAQDDGDDAFDADGLSLDLGSGQARAPGYIGVDLYPYDYGTVVHDVTMGLPFGDETATTVRMVNALHDMDGLAEDPAPLLAEIARVLCPGGIFRYEGPYEISPPAGLQEAEHAQGVAKDGGTGGTPSWYKQAFSRVVPDAATADDAEPRTILEAPEALPLDRAMATEALSYYWSDRTTSAQGNRVAGYESQNASEVDKGGPGSGPQKGGVIGTTRNGENIHDKKVGPGNASSEASHTHSRIASAHAKAAEKATAEGKKAEANHHAKMAAYHAGQAEAHENAVYRGGKGPDPRNDRAAIQHVAQRNLIQSNDGKTFTLGTRADNATPGAKATERAGEWTEHHEVGKSASRVAKIGRIMGRTRTVPIAKASAAKQIVYCVVLSPNESDEQEDFCTVEDIEYACHYWLLNSRVVGADHTRAIKAAPVESYLAPVDFEMTGPYGPQKVVKGAWVVGLKIADADVWDKIANGDYQGVSMGGYGERQPMDAIPE